MLVNPFLQRILLTILDDFVFDLCSLLAVVLQLVHIRFPFVHELFRDEFDGVRYHVEGTDNTSDLETSGTVLNLR